MNMRKIALVGLVAMTLQACGSDGGGSASGSIGSGTNVGGAGGGGDGSMGGSNSGPSGLYSGKTADGRAIRGFLLNNNSYWFVYSTLGSSAVTPSTIAGAVQGTGQGSNGSFSSSNGKDFNLQEDAIYNVTVSATYAAKSSLNGSLSYSDGTRSSFNSQYDTNFDLTASLAGLAGTYTGPAVAGDPDGVATEQVTVNITSSGSITGISASGCQLTGSASIDTSGNVFDVSITFKGGVCANGTNTVSGMAYLDPKTHQLFSAGVNAARDNGFIFLGDAG